MNLDLENSVLLGSGFGDGKCFYFHDPKNIISGNEFSEKYFKSINSFVQDNKFVVGFLSYELFSNKGYSSNFNQLPLFWFGVYENYTVINPKDHLNSQHNFQITNISYKSLKEYESGFYKIKNSIKNGDVYQVNYTFPIRFNFKGNATDFFFHLIQKQNASYFAKIKLNNFQILSFSPELFFSIENSKIKVKPMKGTRLKTGNQVLDEMLKKELRNSPKDLSENLMITDLLRNDLGKICNFGSVNTDHLFQIEELETVFQMTSSVTGDLSESISFLEILRAIFPSGSVTGAPKIRAMELIQELESEKRGIYTGAIGLLVPFMKKALFNVAIRTIQIQNHQGTLFVGSGIVWDSVCKEEYLESLSKAHFFLESNFELFETILLKNKKYFLIKEHLKRMQNSSKELKINFPKKKIQNSLKEFIANKQDSKNYRVRIKLNRVGFYKLEYFELPMKKKSKKIQKITLSNIKTDSKNKFLKHKTSLRYFYDVEYKEALQNGFVDCIFLNENREITEGCISNIFIFQNGEYFTPPIESGLLEGTFRNRLLNIKGFSIKKLYENDLKSAEKIFICNSVQGVMRVRI